MTTLRDALLPVVDTLRGIPAQLGLRLFTVSVVARTWDGSRVGLGNATDSSKNILVDLGQFQVKVELVTARDIIASGGLYTDQDIKIGPVTPPFTGSGPNNAAITDFDPTPGSQVAEIFFLVVGPGYPAAGAYFKKISQDVSKNFRYSWVARKTAEIP